MLMLCRWMLCRWKQVTERAKKLSEVDAADRKIKEGLLQEHETVKGYRAAAETSTLELTRALRTYKLNLAKSAAELQGAHQVVRRLEAIRLCSVTIESVLLR